MNYTRRFPYSANRSNGSPRGGSFTRRNSGVMSSSGRIVLPASILTRARGPGQSLNRQSLNRQAANSLANTLGAPVRCTLRLEETVTINRRVIEEFQVDGSSSGRAWSPLIDFGSASSASMANVHPQLPDIGRFSLSTSHKNEDSLRLTLPPADKSGFGSLAGGSRDLPSVAHESCQAEIEGLKQKVSENKRLLKSSKEDHVAMAKKYEHERQLREKLLQDTNATIRRLEKDVDKERKEAKSWENHANLFHAAMFDADRRMIRIDKKVQVSPGLLGNR